MSHSVRQLSVQERVDLLSNEEVILANNYIATKKRVKIVWATFAISFMYIFFMGVTAYSNPTDTDLMGTYIGSGIMGIPFLGSGCYICILANRIHRLNDGISLNHSRIINLV